MRKAALPSLSTRTEEFTPRELPLPVPTETRPPILPEQRPASRIKEALRRWLDEEM